MKSASMAAATSVIILPREGTAAVDEYNSPDLTQSLLTTPPVTMQTYRALQAAAPGEDAAVATIEAIRVVATDHGGGSGMAQNIMRLVQLQALTSSVAGLANVAS